MDTVQKQFERANGDTFIEWLNAQLDAYYAFSRRAGEAPDLVYSFSDSELFIEVTAGYYDSAHATFLWENARAAEGAPSGWTGVNPDKCLAEAIHRRVTDKSKNRYGSNCILLVVVPPGVTSAEDLARLLAEKAPPVYTPFAGIYVAGRFPITSRSSGGYRVIPIKELRANSAIEREARKRGARFTL